MHLLNPLGQQDGFLAKTVEIKALCLKMRELSCVARPAMSATVASLSMSQNKTRKGKGGDRVRALVRVGAYVGARRRIYRVKNYCSTPRLLYKCFLAPLPSL